MSKEWRPGDVAMARSCGGEFLVVRTGAATDRSYWSAPMDWPSGVAEHDCEFRPLVVIDPESREDVERLRDLMDTAYAEQSEGALDFPARHTGARGNAMQAALREFADPKPPKPPKPDEPTGLGAVVEDATGSHWVSRGKGYMWPWCYADGNGVGGSKAYHDINAVRVLSEGVQP